MNDRDNWRGTVEMIRRAGTRKGRVTGGYFSIEGIRLHERAIRAGVVVSQAITDLLVSKRILPLVYKTFAGRSAGAGLPAPDSR